MKILPTINDILNSQLKKLGFQEFIDPNTNEIIYFDDTISFMQKILLFDDDVYHVVNKVFFKEITLIDINNDKQFKKLWTNSFLNDQIGYQTLELFTTKNIQVFLKNYKLIHAYYQDIDKYLSNENVSNMSGNSNNENNTRTITSELPQSEINLSLDKMYLEYANENIINKQGGSNSHNQNTNTKSYNLNNLIMLSKNNIINNIIEEFDRKCFLQVW